MAAGMLILLNMQTKQSHYEANSRLRELQARHRVIAEAISERLEFQDGIARARTKLREIAGSLKTDIDPDTFIHTLTAKKKGFWSELFNRVSKASANEIGMARHFALGQLERIVTEIADTYPVNKSDIFDLALKASNLNIDGMPEEYIQSLQPQDYEELGFKAYKGTVEFAFWQIAGGCDNDMGLSKTIMESLAKQTGQLDDTSTAYATEAFRRYSGTLYSWLSLKGGWLSAEEREKKMQSMREETRRLLKGIGLENP
jgi:hypothetical protein